MFSIDDHPHSVGKNMSRRELLRIGGLSAVGLSLADVLQLQADSPASPGSTFGRAKNVIFLWLQGGPPQHETWDPKPNAPAEIRGEFQPIQTNVPGMQFCELLPRVSMHADKLAVIRSLATDNHVHSASGYHVLTGYRYRGANARQINPNDWPYFGSVVRLLKPSTTMPPYTTVWLPNVMRLNENVQPAGQTAGLLGRRWDPERITWDPNNADSQIEQFTLRADLPPVRLSARRRLLAQVDQRFRSVEQSDVLNYFDQYTREAFSLLGSGRARRAFDISQEPAAIRDRYGRFKWGQCVLLARRLVEAGVRLVHVNWAREPGDSAVDNPMWDTHALNSDRLQDVLCPQFDISFAALLDDLQQRGLLDETLVVAIAEFGRTPRINGKAGRDHWGNVFSFAMAGAGIRSAQVYGASDRIGGYPRENPVTPGDVTATVFHLLGIDPLGTFRDPENRPHNLTHGTPIAAILGIEPATRERCRPEGDVTLVPPPNDDKLFNADFEAGTALIRPGTGSRSRGWQADHIVSESGFGVRILQDANRRHAALGLWTGDSMISIRQGQRAILAQEIRNARAGQYRFSVQVCGRGNSERNFADLISRHFRCQLMFFRFAERSKDPRRAQHLASMGVTPPFQDGANVRYESIHFDRSLDSTVPGQNFPIGLGLGVAVILVKTSTGVLRVDRRLSAYVSVNEVEVVFGGRRINEDVQV